MDRLIVKNFGPLKDIDIKLNRVNLFIGENGSGKSVLAKLVIALERFMIDTNVNEGKLFNLANLDSFLNGFNINYINNNTIIEYYLNNEIFFLFKDESIYHLNKNIYSKKGQNKSKNVLKNTRKDLNGDELETYSLILSNLMSKIEYIPAERNILSILNESINSLVRYKVPLPDFLLDFASEYEYARKEIKELNALNVKYQFDGTDKVYYDKDNYLKLSHSSSGIQSAIPMLLTAKYFAKKYRGIVIEEPEQNLFPKAQKEVIEFLLKEVNEKNSLFLMTHSPYVLSTLNILMMAHKVGSLSSKASKEVEKIIPKSKWLNRDNFSAYYIEDGKAKNIKGKTGLISENVIDDISDEIDSEFQELLELYREFKNDK